MCRDTVQPGAAIRCSAPYDMAQGRCDTRGSTRHGALIWPWCWVCRDISCDTAGQACDTASQACDMASHRLRQGPRHDRDTTFLGTVRAACAHKLVQGVHLVHPTQFWTQCSIYESLFGQLFMNTVHEVFKKIIIKKK